LEQLNDYKNTIESTSRDLQDHLEDIKRKLDTLLQRDKTNTTDRVSDFQQMNDEIDSAQKCLEICENISSYINGIRFHPTRGGGSSATSGRDDGVSSDDLTKAELITLSAFKDCSLILAEAMSEMRKKSQETDETTNAAKAEAEDPESPLADPDEEEENLQSELASVQQGLSILNAASTRALRVHRIQNVKTGDYGKQLFVSEDKNHLFNVKGASVGDMSLQIIGTLSPTSIQEIFRTQLRNSSK
jgi:hypothetical protein